MKKLVFGLTLLLATSAWANSSAVTAILVKHISSDSSIKTITDQNSKRVLKPASTLKLFTSWMALNSGLFDQEEIGFMLKTSHNVTAQKMLKALGGTSALRSFLLNDQKLPITSRNFIAVDGSGLSHSNRSTCDLQIKLLETIYESSLFDSYKRLLAEPGEEGTLEERLLHLKGQLFAKTGTLRSTIALTGYVEMPQGVTMFCIISENFNRSWDAERKRVDRLLEAQLAKIEISVNY